MIRPTSFYSNNNIRTNGNIGFSAKVPKLNKVLTKTVNNIETKAAKRPSISEIYSYKNALKGSLVTSVATATIFNLSAESALAAFCATTLLYFAAVANIRR